MFTKAKIIFGLCFIVALTLCATPSFAADSGSKININKAGVEELTQLKGIGTVIAGRIVEYREKNGSFESPADITKVDGIGEKTFQSIKDRITVE